MGQEEKKRGDEIDMGKRVGRKMYEKERNGVGKERQRRKEAE